MQCCHRIVAEKDRGNDVKGERDQVLGRHAFDCEWKPARLAPDDVNR